MRFHGIPWSSMRFYDVPMNQSVPTEANRGLTSYNHSEGVKIVGLPTVGCDACGRLKSKRLIRRAPREIHEGPGEQVAIDFHDYEKEATQRRRCRC
jgi:hypothetical protein